MASGVNDYEQMRHAALAYSLSRAPIFAGLPAEDLERLSGYASLHPLPRDAYLFQEGDPVRGFFVVRRGLIHVHRSSGEGQEQILHLLRTGDSFAERALVLEGGYPATAKAVEESEVILIPARQFKAHLNERPELAWRMISSMSHHLRSLVAAVEGLKYFDLETRLVHWLLARCPLSPSLQPVEISFGMKKSELARELATRPETLSRAFRKLGALQLIQLKAHSLVILDPAALRARFENLRLPSAK